MARILNEEQHTEKRNEILDVAQRLVYTRGYAQMSIQEIISALSISKGAFYHYFDSKQNLLEAMIKRTLDQILLVLAPVIDDPVLSATEKLNRYFLTAGQWKSGQKEYILAIMQVWYTDENAIVRQKMQVETLKHIAPMFSEVIHQGIAEGTFHTSFPDQTGEVLLALLVGFGENLAARMIEMGLGSKSQPKTGAHLQDESIRELYIFLEAYTCAMERVLGAPPGSIELVGPGVLEDWFKEPPPTPPSARADNGAAGG